MREPKIIISGGGTGGHIFPAIAIADAIKREKPEAKILFVGANGRMEMEKIPLAGYEIKGLNIAGLQRRLTVKNLSFPFKLAASLLRANRIVKDFQPDVAVGVGGYASGPLLRAAAWKKVPILVQEQNSYPGITNKLLGKAASKICVAYDNMERFFSAAKLIVTGNPVRHGFEKVDDLKLEAFKHFGLNENKKTVLVIGGSLGARTINQTIAAIADRFPPDGEHQLIWQSGKHGESIAEEALSNKNYAIHSTTFINRMDLAYAAADVIVSRAGAMSISELCLIGKACILIPSPNVAEDHQTKNAMALVQKDAAILVKDTDAKENLEKVLFDLITSEERQNSLAVNIKKLAKPNAANDIATEVLQLIK